MSNRWDETWHRLREWTNGQGQSERLAAQILLSEGYESFDPSHPLGGPDGGKDGLCEKGGKKWVMAVFFPREKKSLATIKKKLKGDLQGVAANSAEALAFVTNQELSLADRQALKKVAGRVEVELYYLDRVTTILDQPRMAAVRKPFLNIDFDASVREALEALLVPEREEHEIREALVGVVAAQEELATRGVKPGKYRCTRCGSDNNHEQFGSYRGRSVSVTTCGDCGEHLGDCV